MSQLAQQLADELASAAIDHIEKTGDEDVVSLITKGIGDSSQTLQELFVTSVRVQRAARRAQKMLETRIAEFTATQADEPAAPSAATPPPSAEVAEAKKPEVTGPWDFEE
jgi:uncharacterized coiled-coil protein SlyX